jgi:hypothetical protein
VIGRSTACALGGFSLLLLLDSLLQLVPKFCDCWRRLSFRFHFDRLRFLCRRVISDDEVEDSANHNRCNNRPQGNLRFCLLWRLQPVLLPDSEERRRRRKIPREFP